MRGCLSSSAGCVASARWGVWTGPLFGGTRLERLRATEGTERVELDLLAPTLVALPCVALVPLHSMKKEIYGKLKLRKSA